MERSVAIFKADFKDRRGEWIEGMSVLADSGGCESGVNARFAMEQGFEIMSSDQDEGGMNSHARSATGQVITFDQYVEVDMRIEGKKAKTRFYLMEGLPRNFLIGYPWLEKNGAVIDARKGIMTVEDWGITVQLEKTNKKKKQEAVFAAFSIGCQAQFVQPFKLQAITEPKQLVMSMTKDSGKEFPERIRQLLGEDKDKEWGGDLERLLMDYKEIFDVNNTTPAKVESIQIGLKQEFKGKRFFRPEPLRSEKEQKIIDDNARKLISQGKAK